MQASKFVGMLRLDNVHDETLKPFVAWCREQGNKSKTINNKLGVVRRVLNLAARKWRDPQNGLSWLETPPLITMLTKNDARPPYPISWKEQAYLFPLLPGHLQPMALFMVHSGLRDEECCGLRWDQEQAVEELGVSVFVLTETKNRQERVVVLNSVAQKVIEGQRASRPGGYNNGWQKARREAADGYRREFGRECPSGFRSLHVHDLRHTCGRRLRAAGVSNETRQDILGHKNGNIATHYSAAELAELLATVRRIESGVSAPLLRRVA